MTQILYSPILQTKQNEYAALYELEESVKNYVKPVFTLTDDDKTTRATVLPSKIEKKWEKRNCYIDLNTSADFLIDGEYYVKYVTSELESKQLSHYIDLVVSLESTQPFVQETKQAVANYDFGLSIRINTTSINSELNKNIDSLLETYEKTREEVDLIIDFGSNISSPPYLHEQSIKQICSLVHNLELFKAVVIAGCSLPKDLPRDNYNPEGIEPRIEWQAFHSFISVSSEKNLIYGDHTIVNPAIETINAPVKPNAKIKYTLDQDFLIIVRHQVHVQGFEQYHEMAKYLINSNHFYGANYSEGDTYIAKCANNQSGTGNLGTWVKVGINHHITVIVNQLANYYGFSV